MFRLFGLLLVWLVLAGCQTLSDGFHTYTFPPNSQHAGDTYIGNVINNQWNGKGKYIYADGDTYVGDFLNGKYHGQGTYTFGPKGQFAGAKYVGQYTDHRPRLWPTTFDRVNPK